MKQSVTNMMSWEGGVDLVGVTRPDLSMPNIIIHLARMVHTPWGSAPSGMILYQPHPEQAPVVMGFVTSDAKIGAYFGPHIFAGTPFEQAPALLGSITIESDFPARVLSTAEVGGHRFEVEMTEFGSLELIQRAPAAMPPFWQQVVEAVPGKVSLRVDGQEVALILPPVGISGGPPAVWSPHGIYAR